MALDVIGAGFGRTGTLSLKRALEALGLGPCYHMIEVRGHEHHRPVWAAAMRGEAVDWDALFAGYRSAVDWPACNFWAPLAARYPQARVILSERDPERWYESVRSTIYPTSMARGRSDEPEQRAMGEWLAELIWDGVFGGRLEDREHAIGVYRAHGERVRASVPPERLLVFDPAQGWGPLCAFLGLEAPDEPFPHVNTRAQFRARGGVLAPPPPAERGGGAG